MERLTYIAIGFVIAVVLIALFFGAKSVFEDELHGNYPAFARSFADLTDLRDILDEAPTLTLDDLRPKGRWEEYEDGQFRCSVCKKKPLEIGWRTLFLPGFCYHCGADMRGGGEDG